MLARPDNRLTQHALDLARQKWGDHRPRSLATAFASLMQEAPEPQDYSGFPWWRVLIVAPNREQKAAEWLKHINVYVYLPLFTRQAHRRGKLHEPQLCAVVPGLLFAPAEIMDIDRRDEILKFAHVKGFMRTSDGEPAALKKSQIEIIREIEAKLNLPPERKGVLFKVGQQVRFVNELYAAFWGDGQIFEIASDARIGLYVKKLFGRTTKVYVCKSEIEAM